MVAGVGSDDFYVGAIWMLFDQEPVRLTAFGLVVDAHNLIHGQTGVDGVFTDEVPVSHPGSAIVADGAIVGKGSGGGELFGDSFGESVGLRDGQERCAVSDGFKDCGVYVTELGDGLDGSGFVAGLVFEAGGVAGVLG